MLAKRQSLWSRVEDEGIYQETIWPFSLELLNDV